MYLRNVYQTWQEAVREIVTQLLAFEQKILDCANITFTAAGNIAATNVQDAIEELDTEKAAKAGSTGQAFSCSTLTAATAGSSIAIEAATAPTLLNSWVVDLNDVGYWKDAFGVVHLQGTVTGGSLGTTIFTLPVGYRPPADRGFAISALTAFGAITVLTNGNVVHSAGGTDDVYLDGITFRTT